MGVSPIYHLRAGGWVKNPIVDDVDRATGPSFVVVWYPAAQLRLREVSNLSIEKETLKAMVRDYGGFELSDEELEKVAPALDQYVAEMEKLRELDLSDVMSVRLLRPLDGEEL